MASRRLLSVLMSRRLCDTSCVIITPSSSFSSPTRNDTLHRAADEKDITNMDLIEEKIRRSQNIREYEIQGQKQKWAYRSEMVNALDLDMNHRRIWIAFGVIIIVGFGAFVYVKSCIVLSRKEEMVQRELIRKELNLQGADRKKIALVDN